MCSWDRLRDGSLTLDDLMDMHRSLNLKGYFEAEDHRMNQKGA